MRGYLERMLAAGLLHGATFVSGMITTLSSDTSLHTDPRWGVLALMRSAMRGGGWRNRDGWREGATDKA